MSGAEHAIEAAASLADGQRRSDRGGVVYVQLVLPGIVVPTYRVRRYRPAVGVGRRITGVPVQLRLPFGAAGGLYGRRFGVKVVLTAVRHVLQRWCRSVLG